MFKAEEQRLTIKPKSSAKARFAMQQADRMLTAVDIVDGGDNVRFGDMVLGNERWDGKHVSWPIAVFFTVEVHNDTETEKDLMVKAWHRGVKDISAGRDSWEAMTAAEQIAHLMPATSELLETARVQSPAEVLHTIRIRIRRDGSVDGDLNGDTPIYPRGDQTTDGQCMSIVEEACLRIIKANFDLAAKRRGD